jgi:hypothetical protein
MMPGQPRKPKDIAGQQFGKLTVLHLADYVRNKGVWWVCRCECGTERPFKYAHFAFGATTSCGCHRREVSKRLTRTHGMSGTRIYATWQSMIARCYRLSSQSYRYYGAKGIIVCDRWRNSFSAFHEDMGDPPTDKHEIDRFPNGAGNYEPGNCRWATEAEQNRNTSRNRKLTHDGETLVLREWATRLGIKPATLWARIMVYGWDTQRALTTPVSHR